MLGIEAVLADRLHPRPLVATDQASQRRLAICLARSPAAKARSAVITEVLFALVTARGATTVGGTSTGWPQPLN